MLKIRLQRVGRIHEPSFRLVLTDSKNSTKSGRFKEILGFYDPRKSVDSFKTERIQYWLSQGAGLTATVNNLLIKNKIITGKKIDVSAKAKKTPIPPEATADKVEVKEVLAAEAPTETAPETVIDDEPKEESVESATQPSPEATTGDTIEESVAEDKKAV